MTPKPSEAWLLVLGAGVMQLPAIRAGRRLGLKVAVADANDEAPGVKMAHRFFHTDLQDRDGLLSDARGLIDSGAHLRGVFTAGTDFAYVVAWLAENLDLPGHRYEAALNATEKHRMRRVLGEAGVPIPRFLSVSAFDAATQRRILDELDLPLVVKPVDSMGARGVRKVSIVEELSEAVSAALARSRSGHAILESVIEGQELSLDALVWDDSVAITGVADRHIRFEPYFIEIGHTMPTQLSENERHAVEDVFRRGIRALGLSHGAAKGDIFFGPGGPVVGEIAARLSGGYMSGWTYPYASDFNVTEAAIRLAVGEEPKLPESVRETRVSSERAVVSLPGHVKSVKGLQAAEKAPGVRDVFWKASPGDEVSFPRNNVEKCGNLIVVGPNHDQSRERVEYALDQIEVSLEPGDEKTWTWLFSDTTPPTYWAFPPSGPGYPGFDELHWQLPQRLPVGAAPVAVAAYDPGPLAEIRDWHGRTLESVLRRLRENHGAVFVQDGAVLEAVFWQAVLRGSLQGGVFVLDTIREHPERVRTWLDEAS